MSFFDQVYQSLFPKKDQKNKVLTHELIKRNEAYQEQYRHWSSSPAHIDLLSDIKTAYHLKTKGIEGRPNVHLLQSQYSNGFAVSFSEDDIDRSEFQYLFDWFADAVESLGYRKSNSDVTIIDKGDFIETREKYYLKPPLGEEIPINQQFGNILIEHILIDDQPSFLKLVANIYSDRSYSEAKSFDTLAKYLFDVT